MKNCYDEIIGSEVSGIDENYHFFQAEKMVDLGSNAKRTLIDFALSRYEM